MVIVLRKPVGLIPDRLAQPQSRVLPPQPHRLAPPLNISMADLDEGIDRVVAVIKEG